MASRSEPLLLASTDDHNVTTLTLNRPRVRNALNWELIGALAEALEGLQADLPGAVILTGTGSAFSSGGDIGDMVDREGRPLATKARLTEGLGRLVRLLAGLPRPVICALNGPALGAGACLALACDFIYASSEAWLSFPFARLGLVGDVGGLHTLPRRVGLPRAKELVFTGEKVSAAQALEWGLVNKVVPAAELAERVTDLARRLAAGPVETYGRVKEALQRGDELSLEEALRLEANVQALGFASPNHAEGVAAYLEKREPNYRPPTM